MQAEFSGLSRWTPGSTFVECIGDKGKRYDLHNEHDLMKLSFAFDAADFEVLLSFRQLRTSQELVLSFAGVEEPELDWVKPETSEDSTLLIEIQYYEDDARRLPIIEVRSGCFDLKLRCRAVRLTATWPA